MPAGLERLGLAVRGDGADQKAKVVCADGAADVGGLLDYFMPVPGGVKDRNRTRTLKEFRDIFEIPAASVPSEEQEAPAFEFVEL